MGKTDISQYDGQLVLKNAHDLEAGALKVVNPNREVPSIYDRVDITYNASNSVTQAIFYRDGCYEHSKVCVTGDNSGSLNNKYFILYSALDETKYHVWYNVSGGGTDPAPVGSTAIQVDIDTNDDATIVALATKLAIGFISADFFTEVSGNCVYIKNINVGNSTDVSDFNSGFNFTIIEHGITETVKTINLPYENDVKYIWNDAEHKFEVSPEISVTADIENATTPKITNLNIPTANTEVSHTLVVNLKQLLFRSRDPKTTLKFAWVSGESGTNYITLRSGSIYTRNDIDFAAGTLYIQSDKANTIVEIEEWS